MAIVLSIFLLLPLLLIKPSLSSCGKFCSTCKNQNGEDVCTKCETNYRFKGKCAIPPIKNCFQLSQDDSSMCSKCKFGFMVSRNRTECETIHQRFCITANYSGEGVECYSCYRYRALDPEMGICSRNKKGQLPYCTLHSLGNCL